MKNIFLILLIGFSLMGCGEDQNVEKNSTIDLPKSEIVTKSYSLNKLQKESLCNKKGGCEEDNSDSNSGSTDDSSDNGSSVEDDTNIDGCQIGNIKITEDDQDILDYSNPLIVFDAKYNSKKDNFCIKWKSYNNAKIYYTLYYSYDKSEWKIIDISKEKKASINYIIKKLDNSQKYNKVYIKVRFGGYDNDLNRYVSGYFQIKEFSYTPKIKTEKEILLQEPQTLKYGYYRDEARTRWYISKADSSKKVTVYSLMPIKNGQNGWGVVGKDIATIDLDSNQITIGDIKDSTDNKYYIALQDETIISDKKQSDIEKIRNSTVSIDWWFFKASNGSWYIVNTDGKVYRFGSKKEVDENGNKSEVYDWKKIDLDNAVPNFYIENGVKKVKF